MNKIKYNVITIQFVTINNYETYLLNESENSFFGEMYGREFGADLVGERKTDRRNKLGESGTLVLSTEEIILQGLRKKLFRYYVTWFLTAPGIV